MRPSRTLRQQSVAAMSLALAITFATTFAFAPHAGCNRGDREGKVRIGFANIAENFPFAISVREGIERAAAEAGNVDLIVADNRMDGQIAMNNAENFLVQEVDGLIEFQTDEKFGKAIMRKMQDAKVPVIAIDIPMPGAVFFGVDNHRAGEMAGKALGEWVKKNWEGEMDALIMLERPQSGEIPAERMRGQRDGLESVIGKIEEDNVRHLDSENTLEKAHELVAGVLGGDLSDAERIAIVCINDDTALGAIGAAERAGRQEHIAVVAVDGSERGRSELRKADSRMVGTTASFPEKYGEKLIPLMLKMINGEEVPEKVFTDHVFLTRENVDEYYPDVEE